MDTVSVSTGALKIDFRNTTVNVTSHMIEALERMRAALITVAQLQTTTTYKALAAATGGAYPARGFGKALDVISIDCEARGEPSLACLIVHTGGDHEVGSGFIGDAAAERVECYRHWAV